MKNKILELKNISKSYDKNLVLKKIDFDLYPGEIHSIIGENGAGKSTMMKIISGNTNYDNGVISLQNQQVSFHNSLEAMSKGINIVYQELSFCDNLTVLENFFINREIKNSLGILDWDKMHKKLSNFLRQADFFIEPYTPISQLNIGVKQMLEIFKALFFNSKIIILDEPTSSLSKKEIDLLFRYVKDFAILGVSFIFISHKIPEIIELSDRVSVLRDGELIFTKNIQDTNENDIISAMVGREIQQNEFYSRKLDLTEAVLSVKSLSGGFLKDISIDLKKGEILGMFGLIGAGRTEFIKSIIGEYPRDSGEIFLMNSKVNIKNPYDALQNKIAYLSEDRKNLGLYLDFTILSNVISCILDRFTSVLNGLDFSKSRIFAQKYVDLMNVRPNDINKVVGTLSGGNQQKVLFAKCIVSDPQILIIDEPTKGVDVNAKYEIHEKIKALSDNGVSIILISSELPEILKLSDRIAIFNRGTIVKTMNNINIDSEQILRYSL